MTTNAILKDGGLGERIYQHDGATEWCDCSVCETRLDPATDQAGPSHAEGWDGSCYFCGAPAAKVGMRLSVGDDIRRRREMAGLTQGELAAELDVTQGTVSRWECNREEPPVMSRLAILSVLERGTEDTDAQAIIDCLDTYERPDMAECSLADATAWVRRLDNADTIADHRAVAIRVQAILRAER